MISNNLEWNVFIYDFNNKKIKPYNIFYKGCEKDIQRYIDEGLSLKEAIERWAKYLYWSHAEYEILIGGLFSKEDEFQKFDIYSQIEMNIDRIETYVSIHKFRENEVTKEQYEKNSFKVVK